MGSADRQGWKGKDRRQRDMSGGAVSQSTGEVTINLPNASTPNEPRYTREQLLSIGKLATAKLKPQRLDPTVDIENLQSPLLIRKPMSERKDDNVAASRVEEDISA